MTKFELFKRYLLDTFYYMKAYTKTFLIPSIKETVTETKEHFSNYIEEIKNYFINKLWEKIKPEIQEHLEMAIQEINNFFNSASYEMKEKIVIDYIFEHIHLPLLLRPTKLIAKNILRNKIHEFISERLQKINKINIIA